MHTKIFSAKTGGVFLLVLLVFIYSNIHCHKNDAMDVNISNCKDGLNDKKACLIKNSIDSSIEITKYLMQFFLIYYAGNIVHESGHAGMAKIVYPGARCPEVHLNLKRSSNLFVPDADLLFKIGYIYVHRDSVFSCPFTRSYGDSSPSRFGDFFIAIGGPAAHCLFLYSLLFAKAFKQKYKETRKLKESLIWAIKNAHFPFKNLLEKKGLSKVELIGELSILTLIMGTMSSMIAMGLLPFSNWTDGTLVWQAVLSKNNIKTIPIEYFIGSVLLSAIVLIIKDIKTYREYVFSETKVAL